MTRDFEVLVSKFADPDVFSVRHGIGRVRSRGVAGGAGRNRTLQLAYSRGVRVRGRSHCIRCRNGEAPAGPPHFQNLFEWFQPFGKKLFPRESESAARFPARSVLEVPAQGVVTRRHPVTDAIGCGSARVHMMSPLPTGKGYQ